MGSSLNKRERLALAATVLVHQKGFANTTLADIADKADVALGSVFYYFKTKDDVAKAIFRSRLDDINLITEDFDQLPHPIARLKALVKIWVDDRDIDSLYGCPIGSLCYELAKGRGPIGGVASQLFNTLLDWTEKQFWLMGCTRKRAHVFAQHLVASLQGISLLANALGEPDSIVMEAKFLNDWLDGVKQAQAKKSSA